ncbi:MAG TPA: hypothetical protein VE242_09535 [Chthoniobacterales bacterium]|nr:hypothetical protein [Chthoniobacterales bacterium]
MKGHIEERTTNQPSSRAMYYITGHSRQHAARWASIKVARFVFARLQKWGLQTELLDLLEYNFPIMEERLHR